MYPAQGTGAGVPGARRRRGQAHEGAVVTRTSISGPTVVEQAAAIVASYDTGVSLRQLFYRLVVAEVLPNTRSA